MDMKAVPSIVQKEVIVRYSDGSCKSLRITKCTVLDMDIRKVAIHLDKIGEQEYLLIMNREFAPEGKKIASIDFNVGVDVPTEA